MLNESMKYVLMTLNWYEMSQLNNMKKIKLSNSMGHFPLLSSDGEL